MKHNINIRCRVESNGKVDSPLSKYSSLARIVPGFLLKNVGSPLISAMEKPNISSNVGPSFLGKVDSPLSLVGKVLKERYFRNHTESGFLLKNVGSPLSSAMEKPNIFACKIGRLKT